MSVETTLDKKAKKAAMKKEAEILGISYDELKKRQKRKHHTREAESLDTPEHKEEMKRLRAYSDDMNKGGNKGTATATTSNNGGRGTNGSANNGTSKNYSSSIDHDDANKRRRTRSMDATEENESIIRDEKKLSPEEWRAEHTITLRGHGSNSTNEKFPAPYIEFNDTPFSQRIQSGLTSAGFARPTPIQAQAWPLAVEGKDLISIAKTGSGKTCGFLLPVFHHHESKKQLGQTGGNGRVFQSNKPILLVLAPTRELSVQIMEEAVKFGRPLGIRSVCCYGGAPKYPQIQAVQRGVECIIACPGRLNDLIEMKKIDLSSIQYLVLDEADRMLDMYVAPTLLLLMLMYCRRTRSVCSLIVALSMDLTTMMCELTTFSFSLIQTFKPHCFPTGTVHPRLIT
jgi:ATP-dependent RNA helicase DDX5/DBP2